MLTQELQLTIDKLEVREILDEYCLRLELDNLDHWLDLFTEDTVYDVYKMSLRGREEVRELIGKAPHGTHIGGAVRIAINGDRAETLQNYVFVSTSTDEWNVGWYRRILRRTSDGWKIAHTQVKFGRKDPLPQNDRARRVSYPVIFS